MTKVTLVLLATITLILVAIVLVIYLAKGYEFNPSTRQFNGTGILVATSDPNGASVLINGTLKTATNNSLNLQPDNYDITLQLDGYSPWQKTIPIKQEEVFKTNAFLFPKVPNLTPLTLTGATNPVLSPDQSKIVYSVASASAQKNGLWILDMGRSNIPTPLSGSGDFRQIYQDSLGQIASRAKFLWSPDTKQILAYTGSQPEIASSAATPKNGLTYLLNSDQLNSQLLPLTQLQINQTLQEWQTFSQKRFLAQMSKLELSLASFLTANTTAISFSPDENKVLYQATASATLAKIIPSSIPGTNPTPESRTISPASLYVYDVKEDKNYEIENCKLGSEGARSQIVNCQWFPSSRHLIAHTAKDISIMEYDGTNKAVIYAGPFVDSIVFSWPNWSKVVILTSLNAGIGKNLYSINLR